MTLQSNLDSPKRIIWMDFIRVISMFMVLMIHVRSAFDLKTDAAVQFYCAFLRPCVPLFIMISGALLLPLKTDSTKFFKRRFTRVLIPFLAWSIIYVFLPTPAKGISFGGIENSLTNSSLSPIVKSLLMIPINFTWTNVHFWFIYTIIGLYLFMPIISPWLEKASKRNIEIFLILWGTTLFIPYLKIYFPQIQGECDWNEFGMMYYFSGYLGYLILGYYLRKYNKLKPLTNFSIALILIIIGFLPTYFGLKYSITTGGNVEFFINNLTINVALFTFGCFMIMQTISLKDGIVKKIIIELSKFSYGIFLVHYILTIWINCLYKEMGMSFSTWFMMPILTLIVFILSYGIIRVISFVPKSKYLIG